MSYLVEITNKRQFKSTTGYDKATFTALLTDFTLEYKVQTGKNYEEYLSKILLPEERAKLETLEEVFFFFCFKKRTI
jgi:hypothetical protein